MALGSWSKQRRARSCEPSWRVGVVGMAGEQLVETDHVSFLSPGIDSPNGESSERVTASARQLPGRLAPYVATARARKALPATMAAPAAREKRPPACQTTGLFRRSERMFKASAAKASAAPVMASETWCAVSSGQDELRDAESEASHGDHAAEAHELHLGDVVTHLGVQGDLTVIGDRGDAEDHPVRFGDNKTRLPGPPPDVRGRLVRQPSLQVGGVPLMISSA